jgi:hypothetical protein
MQSSSSRLCRALWGVNSCAGGQVAPRSCQGWIKVELLTKVQVEGPACPPTVLLSDVLEGHATTTFVLAHSPDSHQHSCWFLLVWKGAPCIFRLQFSKLVLEGLAVWKKGGRIQRDGSCRQSRHTCTAPGRFAAQTSLKVARALVTSFLARPTPFLSPAFLSIFTLLQLSMVSSI